MKNPIIVTIEDNKHVEIGDPFILRFNGRYYLYCSTCDEVEGIRCFISEDLVNFKYYGLVAKSPILKHAYAPEVIFYNDEFIMCTSPRGNGHYLLKSKSPLGPFEFVSDNLHNMIDGSFVLDSNNKLHFLRADHNGIAYLDYENNKFVNRKDILPQISHAWTEGPSVTYFNKYYYVTYCGNDVLSTSYRVKLASSKYIDKDYRVNASPLILSTKDGYSGLGHNSIVIGPSLDEYFIAYHKLDWVNEHQTTRYLCLDRLYFNGRECACNISNFEVLSPRRPDIECHINVNNTLDSVEDKLLTPLELKSRFTGEFNFKGYTDIVVAYKDSNNYSLISFKNELEIYEIINGNKYLRLKKNVKFDFNHFHSVRIINSDRCEILIDNAPILETKRFDGGKCGYIYKDSDLFYLALTNSTYIESLKQNPFVIPGKIESNYIKTECNLIFGEDEINYLKVKKGESINFKVTGEKKNKYYLFGRIKNRDVTLKISSLNEKKIVNINENESEYLFDLRFIDVFELDSNDQLNIEVLKGTFEFQYLKFDLEMVNENLICNSSLDKEGEYYLFTKNSNLQQINFSLNDIEDNLFGLIVNAKDYSSWRSNKALSYLGYFVGFDRGLLVVDYCQYDRIRIYDKPYHLEKDIVYKLQVEVIDNVIKVYVNDKLEIQTVLKYDEGYGLSGVYKSKYTKIKLFDYKGGIVNEK